MATSEAQKRATAKYNREHSKYISLKFNTNSEEDAKILKHLSGIPSRQKYLKELILQDMNKGKR